MSTQFSPEQFASVHKAQIDGLLTFANTAFVGLERLAALTPRPRINFVLHHGVLSPHSR